VDGPILLARPAAYAVFTARRRVAQPLCACIKDGGKNPFESRTARHFGSQF